MRVLVVEDDARMGAALRRGLGYEGMAADVAADGDEAMPLARANDYDAIVLDVMLPGLDGFETCRRMRAAGRLGAGDHAHRARRGADRVAASMTAPTTT